MIALVIILAALAVWLAVELYRAPLGIEVPGVGLVVVSPAAATTPARPTAQSETAISTGAACVVPFDGGTNA